MKNIFKKYMSFFLLICSLFLFNVTTFANGQQPIYVTINGKPMNFKEAKPHINNQRAMVPIRETAEALGATIDWNKTTETMNIVKGSRVAVHKMRSKVITVNGISKTFDTPSINVNDRTLMPVIMLSEAIGNRVTWDNATRTVNIITDVASVSGASIDKTNVYSGERVIFTVLASPTTEKIKLVDINNNTVISENNTYTINSDGTRTFSIPWTPNVDKNTYKSIKVVAGTLSGYNEDSYKVCNLTILSNNKGRIIEAKSDKTEIGRGDEIKLTIKATSNTTRIKIVDDENSSIREIVNYKIENGLNLFETTMKIDYRGNINLKIYPGNSTEYDTNYETIKLTVGGAGSGNSADKNAKLTLHNILVTSNKIFAGENVELKVYSSSDISKIEIYDENEKMIDKVIAPISKDTENNVYTWSLRAFANKEGLNRLKIIAYDQNNYSVRENLNIVATAYNKNDLHIINVSQRDSEVIIGDVVKFTVKTTRSADKLKVFDGERELQTINSSSTEGDYKYWDFRIEITSSNKDRLSVVAYNGNLTDSVKLSTYISEAKKAKIYSVKVNTPEVSLNEYIRITVYTNKAVSKVWVEDNNGYKVISPKTDYDRKSGEEYEWDLRIPADISGERITYNVFAQDSNGGKVDDYFRVKVTK